MADRKITDLTALAAGSQATGDLLTIVDVSESAAADKNKKITVESLFKGIPGNVGVGTSSPSGLLHVNATSNAYIYSSTTTNSVNGFSGAFDTSGFDLGTTSNHPVTIYSNNGPRITVTNGGLVGIGTTSPSVLLDVAGTSGSSSVAEFSYTGGNSVFLKLANASNSLGFIGYETQDITFYNNNNESMRIDSSGRLGVGTSSPGKALSVKGSSYGQAEIVGPTGSELYFVSAEGGSSNGTISYNHASNYMNFYTAGSERMRLDSSGRLLVGTSSAFGVTASELLQVANSNGGKISLLRNDSSIASGNEVGVITWYSADGNTQPVASVACFADADHATNDKPGRLVFSTTADGGSSPSERLRVDSAGAISTDNSAYAFFRSDSTTTTSLTLRKDASAADAVDYFQCRNTANTLQLVIQGDGDVYNVNNTYGSLSDSKLKENIVDASSQWSDIKNLQVRRYNFTETSGYPTHTQIGLIAQEVETVSPGLVNDNPDVDEDGNDLGTVTKSVRYSVLYMKAVKALQEAMDRIETLETSNADLLARVAALEAG